MNIGTILARVGFCENSAKNQPFLCPFPSLPPPPIRVRPRTASAKTLPKILQHLVRGREETEAACDPNVLGQVVIVPIRKKGPDEAKLTEPAQKLASELQKLGVTVRNEPFSHPPPPPPPLPR